MIDRSRELPARTIACRLVLARWSKAGFSRYPAAQGYYLRSILIAGRGLQRHAAGL
jgi:hypothetical protein